MALELYMPIDIGSDVISGEPVQELLRRCPDVSIVSTAPPVDDQAFHDFGATAIAILGTAAAAKAVAGLVSIIRTAIAEAHKTSRLRAKLAHEREMLLLRSEGRVIKLDLTLPLEEVLRLYDSAALN